MAGGCIRGSRDVPGIPGSVQPAVLYGADCGGGKLGFAWLWGPDAGRIAVWICRTGVALVAAGLLVGALASIAVQSFLRSQLYGVRFAEPSVWAGVLGVVGVMGVLACALPAWRAARVNPGECLR